VFNDDRFPDPEFVGGAEGALDDGSTFALLVHGVVGKDERPHRQPRQVRQRLANSGRFDDSGFDVVFVAHAVSIPQSLYRFVPDGALCEERSMSGFLIVGLLTIAAIAAAFHFGLHVDPENVPSGSPAWRGPDPAALADALVEHLTDAGVAPRPRGVELEELACHHAFDMATRDIPDETTPEGETLTDRFVRLHPRLVGEAAQWQLLAPAEPTWQDARRAIETLVAGPDGESLRAPLAGPEINELGVGAAVERGRVGLCVVLMSRWATLDDTLPPPAHDGWTFRGTLGGDTDATHLGARFREAGGPWSDETLAAVEDQGEVAPDVPTRFRLTLPIAPDALDVEVQFVRRGVHGRTRGL
jgi:hypothetical protein